MLKSTIPLNSLFNSMIKLKTGNSTKVLKTFKFMNNRSLKAKKQKSMNQKQIISYN